MLLTAEAIKIIDQCLKDKETIEVHVEKGNIVIVKLNRKVIDKTPISE